MYWNSKAQGQAISSFKLVQTPNSPIELFDKFEALIGKIEAENVESNIIGDFNCDMMAAPANETRHLIELCESHQYAQLIKEPTRVSR